MAKKTFSFNCDEETVRDADKLFASFGIDTETAVSLFLHQAVLDKGLPFSIRLPANSGHVFSDANTIEQTKRCHESTNLAGGTIMAHPEASCSTNSLSCMNGMDLGAFNDDDEEIGCQG